MNQHRDFSRLNRSNHVDTSPATSLYNCIAWAAGDAGRWWEPGRYWPVTSDRLDHGLNTLIDAFKALGFELCEDGEVENDFEKVALFASFSEFTHAARQLPTGKWTSKLGKSLDIEHDSPRDVAGGLYGEVAAYMKRRVVPIATSES